MNSTNCIIVDDERIAREILEGFVQKIPAINLIRSCKNVTQAIEVTSNTKIDLIFLDINMPNISGLTFAKIIDPKIKIIFTTAYREYAVDGFDIQAVDYLLKPFSFDRFKQSIQRFVNLTNSELIAPSTNNYNNEEKQAFIFVRSDRKMVKINFKDIIYIESLGDYLNIHLVDKIIITRETISNIEAKLDHTHFLRIHRSFIISINKITSYTKEFIEINKKALPISRTYKENVIKCLF